MKHQYRMIKNYLKGSLGGRINAMMAAAAYNFKKWMNKICKKFLQLFYFLVFIATEKQIVTRKWSC